MTSHPPEDWEKHEHVGFMQMGPTLNFISYDEKADVASVNISALRTYCKEVESLATERAIAVAEKLKRPAQQVPTPCPDLHPSGYGCLVYHYKMEITAEDELYNRALSDLIARLRS